jgi:pyridoxal phosphate enzyme (YggS family)
MERTGYHPPGRALTVNEEIKSRLEEVRRRIDDACRRAGRAASDVTIIGVTKTFGPEAVDALFDAGVRDIAESRIQEFLLKRAAVTRPCRWHFVGTLQRNKAAKAFGCFELIHSVDNVKLAEALNRLGGERGAATRVLLEVNTSGEPSKHGFAPAELERTVAGIAALGSLSLDGLMTVGPLSDDTGRIRRSFALLRELGRVVERGTGRSAVQLSMGMSDDFEIAVEEGATMIRLGRIILGDRERSHPPESAR